MRESHRRIQERFPRRSLELPPLFGQRPPPAAACLAYNLVNLFRLLQLPQAWRSIQIETLRARLFKIGARIRQTARCIRVHLATGWPWQALFGKLALALNTS